MSLDTKTLLRSRRYHLDMSEQLKLDNFKLPKVAIDDRGECSPKAKIICGECGAVMWNSGIKTSRRNQDDDDIIGEWLFTCKAQNDGSVNLLVSKDGSISYFDNVGSNHQIVEIDDKKLANEMVETDDEGNAHYVYKKLKPELWEDA